jgi:hypothetical protein
VPVSAGGDADLERAIAMSLGHSEQGESSGNPVVLDDASSTAAKDMGSRNESVSTAEQQAHLGGNALGHKTKSTQLASGHLRSH